MEDRKVKGTMLLGYVRIIRANKDKDWDKYLEPEDWEVVNGRILPSVWYPFEIFRRCGVATFHLIAEENLDLVRLWGKASADQFLEVYKTIGEAPDPITALERYIMLRGTFFNFEMFAMKIEKLDEKHMKVRTNSFDPNDPAYESYTAQLIGSSERIIELTGGKNPKLTLESKEWEGAPETVIDAVWE